MARIVDRRNVRCYRSNLGLILTVIFAALALSGFWVGNARSADGNGFPAEYSACVFALLALGFFFAASETRIDFERMHVIAVIGRRPFRSVREASLKDLKGISIAPQQFGRTASTLFPIYFEFAGGTRFRVTDFNSILDATEEANKLAERLGVPVEG